MTGDEAASSFMSGNSSRVGSTQVKRRTWRLSHGIAVGDEPWTVRELVNLVFLREVNRAGSVRAERRPPPWPWWRRHGISVRGAVNGLPAAPQSVFGRIQ